MGSSRRSGEHYRPEVVLVVEDEELVRWSIARNLEEQGFEVFEAASATEGRTQLRRGVDLVLLDYQLDAADADADGLELLAEMRERADVAVIMMTGHSSVEHAVEAMRAGAVDYLAKPFELDDLQIRVERALAARRARQAGTQEQSDAGVDDLLVGKSPPMRDVKRLLRRIAVSASSTVLITGESGTGKDLAARAIHQSSDRREAPFLNITCSALPASLLESELFGYERGAFTDAKARKRGLLEHAHGGTVFLDELAEMPLSLQAKLLRFLEEKSFRRVGAHEDIHCNVRIIAATNVDLREAIRVGRFRDDLYYRLAVLPVHLPPLRTRPGDVKLLARFFLERFAAEFDKPFTGLAPSAMQRLEAHSWPGNVRELRNVIERAALLSEGDILRQSDIRLDPTEPRRDGFELPAGGLDLRALERDLLEQALQRTHGNQTRAAKLLGMNRDQVRYRIERFGLRDKP